MDLEKITDLLLEGKISNKKAEELFKKIKQFSQQKKEFMKSKEEIYFLNHDKINYNITIKNGNGIQMGYLKYFEGVENSGQTYFIIESTETLVQKKGLFRKMFDTLVELGEKKNISHVELEVDSNNKNAKEVYKHLGFHNSNFLNFDESFSITLRKDF